MNPTRKPSVNLHELAVEKSKPRPGWEVIADPFHVLGGVSTRHSRCQKGQQCEGVGCNAYTGKTKRKKEALARAAALAKKWRMRQEAKEN